MRTITADPVGEYVADLGEGPCWLASGQLSWVDVLLGRVLVADADRGLAIVGEHDVGRHVGAALPVSSPDQGWLLAAASGFAHLAADGSVQVLAEPEAAQRGDVRMNDAACDPVGRAWAGSMAYDERPGAGSLFRVDLDGSVTRVLGALQIANGIDWSPDGRTLYFNDSGHRVVYCATYDIDRGVVGPLRPLVSPPAQAGAPDGLTVDAEGALWVAMWGGGQAHRYAPDGRLLARVRIGSPLCTSCCLGGEDGRTLFITSASRGLTASQRRGAPDAGRMFAARVDVPGRPCTAFAGVLPAPGTSSAQRAGDGTSSSSR